MRFERVNRSIWRRTIGAGAAVALAAMGLLGTAPVAQAADSACSGYSSASTTCTVTARTIGGASRSTSWYLPNGAASAVMLLEHGFSRKCANLRGTSRAIAEKGLMVLCVDADLSGGNPALATQVADALAAGTLAPPAGRPMPSRIIAGGHSAGGHFAALVGQRLAQTAPTRLAGAVLFDPVADAGFSTAVAAISDSGRRPVLSVAARPSLTNLYNNSFGALTALDNPFVGIQLVWARFTFGWPTGGSCHVDVEGENTDALGTIGAGCSPNATQTARLRDLGSTWARDLATGTRTSAYWCGDANVVSTCGSVIRDLVDRTLPLAVPIR